MMGWNPSGNPAGTQRAVVQKPLSVLRPDPHHIPPWGALMDKWGSGSSAVSPEVYFCHTRVCAPPCSMHLQPCGMRLGGLVVRVHHVLSCVPRWLVNKLCSSLLPGHKHVDMHAVKPGHALRSVLSQFVCFLVTVTFWRHSGCSQDTWPHVLRILTIRDLVWLLLFLHIFIGLCSVSIAERRHSAVSWQFVLVLLKQPGEDGGVSVIFVWLFSVSVWVSGGKHAWNQQLADK